LEKLKKTITVDNQFHRSYQMENVEKRLKLAEEQNAEAKREMASTEKELDELK